MRKVIIIILILVVQSGFIAECQNFVDNPAVPKKTLSFRVKKKVRQYSFFVSADSIEPSYLRHLYMEFENPLTISVSGVPVENIYVTFNRGLISGGNGKYIVIPLYDYDGGFAKPNGTGNIEIFANIDSNEVISVGVVEFDLISAPGVIADMGGKTGGKISKEFLLSQSYLNISQAPFPFTSKYNLNVCMFTVVAKPALRSKMEDWIGNQWGFDVFTDDMIKLFEQLKQGDCVEFPVIVRTIQTGYRKGQMIRVQPLRFLIE